MKKILIVQGGGRADGNTAQLVSHFVKGGRGKQVFCGSYFTHKE